MVFRPLSTGAKPGPGNRPVGHEASAITYVSTTRHDPAVLPTWSTGSPTSSAGFRYRAARFRTDLWSLDETWETETQGFLAVSEKIAQRLRSST